jgi:ankyrin repeat protein
MGCDNLGTRLPSTTGIGDRNVKIHECASIGDCNAVRKELANGASVDARDEQDHTPLAHAAKSSANVEVLRLLIEAGADVNAAVDHSKSFPLGLAACSGDISKVRCLLDAGANINFVSPMGYTVLINVMYSLHGDENLIPTVDFLVTHGAEIDCQTEYGESPLSVASILGRFDAVKYLLNASADSSPLQWTELMKAVVLGRYEEVEKLLETSNLDSRDKFGRTAWLLTAVVGDVKKAELLHSHGVNLDERGRMGDTALMICAGKGHAAMVQWLIETEADINAVDDAGNTALIMAAQEGETDCVRVLLNAGVDSSTKNSYNQNAMSMASNEPIIRLLAEVGEDIGEISTEMKRTLTRLKGCDSLKLDFCKQGVQLTFGADFVQYL